MYIYIYILTKEKVKRHNFCATNFVTTVKWQTMSGKLSHLKIWGLTCHNVKTIRVFFMDIPQKILLVYDWDFFFKDSTPFFILIFGGTCSKLGAVGHGLSGLWV